LVYGSIKISGYSKKEYILIPRKDLADHLYNDYGMNETELMKCEKAYRNALNAYKKTHPHDPDAKYKAVFTLIKFYDSLVYYICLHDLQFLGESKYDRFIAHNIFMFI
jgi:hypothetical protein